MLLYESNIFIRFDGGLELCTIYPSGRLDNHDMLKDYEMQIFDTNTHSDERSAENNKKLYMLGLKVIVGL